MEAEVPLQEISIYIENQEAEVPSQAMVTSLREEMNKLDPLTDSPCIYRVPEHIRVINPAAYTPTVVSIGPIHHKREGLEAMEEYKQRYLQLFLERVKMCLEDYAKFVKDREESLRECYADKFDLKSDEFVKIMMVDSAFVYEMLDMIRIKIDKNDTSTKIFNKPCLLLNVIEDLMLLENQIPLFILKDLFNLDKEAKWAPRPKSPIRSDDLEHLDAILPREEVDITGKIQTEPDMSSSNLEDASKVEEQRKPNISSDLVSRNNMLPPHSLDKPRMRGRQRIMIQPGSSSFSSGSILRGRRPLEAGAESSDNLPSEEVDPAEKVQTESDRSSSNLKDAPKVEENGKSNIPLADSFTVPETVLLALIEPGIVISRGPPPQAGADSFMDLVCKFINWRPEIGVREFDSSRVCYSKVMHLLDCLRICHLSTDPDPPPSEDKTMFLSSLISGCLRPFSETESYPPSEADGTSHLLFSVPTITELHQSGVTFAKRTGSTCLLDIEFNRRQRGILEIPHLFMGDSTEPVFRNLLAFEQCHYEDDRRFTDYFTLLDQLIDDPSDVDLLVRSEVIENTLGDHTRAASAINNMTLGLTVSRKRHFDVLRTKLTKYYKEPWHKWRATQRQDYFNNPWAVISVIAATILLSLTIVQTVYAIISK